MPSPTNSSSSATAQKSDERDSPFQVLADGTQDLAALVGIFATASVERYSIDYNKGYLSASSATLSLLGLRGYVRALVKLGLGSKGCYSAGFDTWSMRPLFGVPDHDQLPSDVGHEVHYVERIRMARKVAWKLAASRKHTVDTMPILDLTIPFYRSQPNTVSICSCRLNGWSEKFLMKSAFYRIPLIWAACIGVTCFMILPFRGGLSSLSWTLFYATVGLALSLWISSLAWFWDYVREQLPIDNSDWVIQALDGVPNMNKSLEKKDCFAFTGSKYSYVTFDLKAVTGRARALICTLSIFCALSAIVGYICQYVEIRQTSPAQAAKWLAVQGVLAILRVVIWIWNPDFDDFVVSRSRPGGARHSIHLSEAQIVMLWYTHVQPTRIYVPRESLRINKASTKAEIDIHEQNRRCAARPPHWGLWHVPRQMPAIPLWALPGLDRSWWDRSEVFNLARRLRAGGPTWQQDVEAFMEAPSYWDLPGWVFMLWVDGHTNQDVIARQSEWKAYNCRIIKTSDGEYHFIPYWTTRRIYRFVPGWLDKSVKPSILHDNRELPLTIYGAPDDDDRIMYEFSQSSSLIAETPRLWRIRTGRKSRSGGTGCSTSRAMG
ncbi:MAG: hypothetical protein Q9207_006279 [Kuettlingeria erythrocarpa]